MNVFELDADLIASYGEYCSRRPLLAAYDELTIQGLRPRTEGYR
ncbi:hypothetical protein C7451_1097 [Blastomonas natatoria]|uniref:Uncharacterized protein n=1 Tax=Blastomonas natatoria TaxID=34015 RepID=A0A2V3UWJ5_9SPHN|nr:hypothetical protein [Blastomonas natatoria]PXW73722.1 hypothetical protein C7451_1097 [Blastomonas natatoria]